MDLTELYKRIRSQQSILFLGQKYLQMPGQVDPFLEQINQQLFKGQEPNLDYKRLSKLLSQRRESVPNNNDLGVIRNIAMDMDEQPWLQQVLDMGWATFYTSSIDGAIERKTGERNILPIFHESTYPGNLMSRKIQHCTYLYKNLFYKEANVPVTTKELNSANVTASKLLNRISDDLIKNRGILVIDGWRSKQDWVSPEKLLDHLFNFHEGSVYLFSADEETLQDEKVQGLMEEGILQVEQRSLYQCFADEGYFEDSDKESFIAPDVDEGIIITLRKEDEKHKGKFKSQSYSISYRILNQLSSSIQVMDDSLLENPYVTDRLAYFVRFLSTGQETPFWMGYNAGLYFERDQDKELEDTVYNELNKDPLNQRIIILEGQSNSGKTAMLGNLAMKLKKDQRYPVIFINNYMDEAEEYTGLKSLIKDHFINRMKAERVIVILDKNTYQNSGVYKKLRDALADSKALIIGSSYRVPDDHHADSGKHKGKKKDFVYVSLGETLYENDKDHINEMQNLRSVLDSISPEYVQKFDILRKKLSAKKTTNKHLKLDNDDGNDFHLFLILQRLFQYEYSQDSITMRSNQTGGLIKESISAEEAVDKFWKSYMLKLNYGVNAEFLRSLEGSAEGMGANPAYKEFGEGMRDINEVLAIAGQFDIPLPLDLLLRIFNKRDYMQYLINSIERDSMVRGYTNSETGEYFVKFRHHFEAEKYIEHNFTERFGPEGRKEKEVDILLTILRNAKYDYTSEYYRKEVIAVTELIRKFGPNGPGNENKNGNEGSKFIYQDYFNKIESCIDECDYSNNPEMVLVRAHFLREAYPFITSNMDIIQKRKENMDKARDILASAIEKLKKETYTDTKQMGRLQVEFASNLVRTLPDEKRTLTPDEIKVYGEIIRLLNSAIRNGELTDRTLDVYLNACIKRCCVADQDEECAEQLAKTTEIIDKTPNLDETENIKLLGKICRINDLAQKAMKTDELFRRLTARRKDTAIYLKARDFWRRPEKRNTQFRTMQELQEWDLFYTDEYDPVEEGGKNASGPSVGDDIVAAAVKTIDFFEQSDIIKIVEGSERCLSLYIRAKWIAKTGNHLFKVKQHPCLAEKDWTNFNRYASLYINLQPEIGDAFPYFLHAVYEFCFLTDTKHYLSSFSELKNAKNLRKPRDWFPNFIYWCDENGKPLQVKINIVPTPNGGFEAEIADGTRKNAKAHLPETLKTYFDLIEMAPRMGLKKPCIVGFNLKGPIIAPIPEREKRGD